MTAVSVRAMRMPAIRSNISLPHIHLFSVGGHLKGKGNILVNWGSCPIMPPNNPLNRPSISSEEANAFVGEMLSWKMGTHPYLAYEASKMFASEEITDHTVAIMAGSVAEDRVFLPGETVDDLIISVPKDLPRESRGAMRKLLEGKDLNIMDNFFLGLTGLMRKMNIPTKLDALNRPYMAHFLDAEGKGFHKQLGSQKLAFVSAKSRILKYWGSALEDYRTYHSQAQKEEKQYEAAVALTHAYLKLGHILHLVCDLCVPAHVLNDLHAPGLAHKDSLELWMTLKRTLAEWSWDHIAKKNDDPNVRIWGAKSLTPPSADPNFDLDTFINSLAHRTRRFRSVDMKGRELSGTEAKEMREEVMSALPGIWHNRAQQNDYLDQQRTGYLAPLECFMQGGVLVPQAILASATIIANFRAEAKKLSTTPL